MTSQSSKGYPFQFHNFTVMHFSGWSFPNCRTQNNLFSSVIALKRNYNSFYLVLFIIRQKLQVKSGPYIKVAEAMRPVREAVSKSWDNTGKHHKHISVNTDTEPIKMGKKLLIKTWKGIEKSFSNKRWFGLLLLASGQCETKHTKNTQLTAIP